MIIKRLIVKQEMPYHYLSLGLLFVKKQKNFLYTSMEPCFSSNGSEQRYFPGFDGAMVELPLSDRQGKFSRCLFWTSPGGRREVTFAVVHRPNITKKKENPLRIDNVVFKVKHQELWSLSYLLKLFLVVVLVTAKQKIIATCT